MVNRVLKVRPAAMLLKTALAMSLLTLAETASAQTTVTSVVSHRFDDMEEYVAGGGFDYNSSDLEMTTEGSGEQIIGFRFSGINIPKGAVITKAYIQFTADEAHSGATTLKLEGIAQDSVSRFDSAQYPVSPRPRTSAFVNWNVPAWSVIQERGSAQQSADIKDIIQEIVNRSGWKSGNAMGIVVSGSGKRVAESYEGATAGDAGHAANQAATLVIEYGGSGPVYNTVGVFPVPANAKWNYSDVGVDLGTAWRSESFNDSTWKFGPAELGYGDNDEATKVGFGPDANNKYITTYFRHRFMVKSSDLQGMDSVLIRLRRDDGAVVYLNGTELFRSNMPTGSIAYNTFSGNNIGSETAWFDFRFPKSILKTGINTLAAEVHQDAVTSSDVSFALNLSGYKSDLKLINSGSAWKYNDKGQNLGTAWKEASYKDNSWSSGNAVLGYGNGDEATVLSAGKNPAQKPMTVYFRKSFSLADTAGFSALQIRLKRDDGAVVYINGKEVFRSNMLPGTVNYKTPAANFVEGADEDMWVTANVSKSVLVPGNNVVAVEVHQNAPTSTDLRFDLDLKLPAAKVAVDYTMPNMTCDPFASSHIGCFTSVVPTPQQQLFRYPSTHTFQVLMQSLKDKYTSTGEIIPNGNDFTGFIPENGSSTKGWLSVNHENSPGGVSMLRIHLDEKTNLWVVDSIQKVDFSGAVKTERNCSGGVTPWGTVITSEETYNSGDVNSDGYTDVGFNVEIDPRTGKIRDYNGDGKPDKLWAAGRMSHENVVVANDSLTLYQGEDGGTGCVYKFVADKKADLSAGSLYVLKRDNATSATGTWVKVPNTTQTERNTARDIAGSLGGYRFGGVEDVEISPVDGKIYFTEKGRGDIWRFKDNGTTVSGLEVFVAGNSLLPIHHEGGVATENYSTGNDNLGFDDEGNLWVEQDGGRDHIWVVRKEHTAQNPMVDLFATSPAGSEPTGITFTPDYKYFFTSFQNASGSNTASSKDAAGNDVVYNSSITIVVSRKEFLGMASLRPNLSLGKDTTICEGASLTLKAKARDGVVVWYNGSTDSTLTVDRPGTYYATAYANNGQTVTDSIRVDVSALPRPFVGNDTTICKNCSLTLDAGTTGSNLTYLWSNGATTRNITVNTPGRYTVTVKNSNGCSGTDAINVYQTTTGLAELQQARFSLAALPNPFGEQAQIRLELKESATVKLEVFDLAGRKVAGLAQGQFTAGAHNFRFAPREFGATANVYIIQAEINGKASSLRLIQQ